MVDYCETFYLIDDKGNGVKSDYVLVLAKGGSKTY